MAWLLHNDRLRAAAATLYGLLMWNSDSLDTDPTLLETPAAMAAKEEADLMQASDWECRAKDEADLMQASDWECSAKDEARSEASN